MLFFSRILGLFFSPIILSTVPNYASAKDFLVADYSGVQEGMRIADKPIWLIRAHTGLGMSSDARLSIPLGVQVGRLWPKLGLGIDVVGDLVTATSGVSVYSDCLEDTTENPDGCIGSAEMDFFSGRVGISPHYGGAIGRIWLYGQIPIFASLHPIVVDRRPKISVYMNYGAGIGMLVPFARSGIIGFDVVGFVGTSLSPVIIKQLQGPIRGGGEARFQISWKI